MRSSQPEIESKNLSLLEDRLRQEALAAKKSEVYAEYFADPQLKSCAQRIAKHHRDNFSSLLGYLEMHQ